ncbi:MAG: acetate/propionate family kinase [Candidatus Saccharibacteria bacterium]|nr:acetate/propionate family kinase [Candidatus Saccharibacteria bacterium]
MAKSINILTVNAGSSSIKCSLYSYESTKLQALSRLEIASIGQGDAIYSQSMPGQQHESRALSLETMTEAQEFLFGQLDELLQGASLDAVGHRVVHGGPKLHTTTEIAPNVLSELEKLQAYDPEHAPAAVSLIRRFYDHFQGIRQYASFDTGFFHDLPVEVKLLPLPREYYSEGLRKYGFHGLSYRSILQKLKDMEHRYPVPHRLIVAHLGSGASVAAIKDGHPVDTTMAFTPASGIPMSTRSGDLDPGVVSYLATRYNLDVNAFNELVHEKSGLLGMSELSGNMLTLLEAQATNQSAAEAVSVFCYQVRKAIGSLAAALGGIDALVFTGGIGEKSAEIRQRIAGELDHLGIELDHLKNQEQATVISHRLSGARVFVLPSDESIIIAQDTVNLLTEKNGG